MDIMKYPKKFYNGAISMTKPVFDGIGKRMDTVTGKAVIEQVVKFAQETDAVNTAIVTRIYQILDRQTKLEEEIKDAQTKLQDEIKDEQRKHKWTRTLAFVSIALNACCIFAIVYILIFARGK